MSDEITEAVVEALNIPTEGDAQMTYGDWKGSAADFSRQHIHQSALTEMREKDKAEVTRQVAAGIDSEKARMTAMYQEARMRDAQQNAQRAQPRQVPQGGTFNDRIEGYYKAMMADTHQGYVHADQLRPLLNELVSAVSSELGSRDRVTGALGQKLDQWYKEYGQQMGTLGHLSGHHADTAWTKFVDDLCESNPQMPRTTIEALASAYEASPHDTADSLREAIGSSIGEHISGIDKHRQESREAERRQAADVRRLGLAGTGGAASPAKPADIGGDAGSIADAFFDEAEPAS